VNSIFNIETEPFEAYSEFDESLEAFDTELADQEREGEVNRRSSEYIRWVQQSLNRILGLRLAVDGVMGRQTRSAIRSFQQQQGLTVDGIVGSQTERALVAAGASPPPGVPSAPAPTPSPPPSPPSAFRTIAVETPGGGRIKDKTPPRASDLVTITGVGGKRIQLHRLAAQAWQALVSAARANGIREPLLLPVSGYRSPEHQERLWRDALARYGSAEEARKWVAPPGGSAHQTGRAIDFYLGDRNSSSNVARLRMLPAYKWLVANAARFGFYPYEREPWHWEYNPPATGQFEFAPPSFEILELGEEFQDEGSDIASEYAEEVRLFDGIRERMTIYSALIQGERDENKLTNLVFFARHPERQGRKIMRGEPDFERLSQEWLDIRNKLVRPILSGLPSAAPISPSVTTRPPRSTLPGKVAGQKALGSISVPIEHMVPGIDVAHWEGRIDWARVAGEGIRFAYIKATQGRTGQDKLFRNNWEGAKAHGIIRGAYHLLMQRSSSSVEKQAQNFLNTVTLTSGDMPPALDVETKVLERIIAEEGVEGAWKFIYQWVELIKQATGYTPVLYMSPRGASKLKFNFGKLPALDLWIPRYGINPPIRYPIDKPNIKNLPLLPLDANGNLVWQQWRFWQYSSKGQVAGIPSHVDLNFFNGNDNDFNRWLQQIQPRANP
jgi:lysozyme